MTLPRNSISEGMVFQLSIHRVCSFVRSSEQILLPQYLMNGSIIFGGREHSFTPTDDLTRCWRSKVKVSAGRRAVKASTSMLGCQSPSSFLCS